jgi:hypothetical protein
VQQALSMPDASLDARLAEAIVAKQRPLCTLIKASPHAAELFSYSHSMAGELFANLDVEIVDMLRAAMAEDAELAPDAAQLARALYFGGGALANRTETLAQMESEVGAFARAQIAGARALSREDR